MEKREYNMSEEMMGLGELSIEELRERGYLCYCRYCNIPYFFVQVCEVCGCLDGIDPI